MKNWSLVLLVLLAFLTACSDDEDKNTGLIECPPDVENCFSVQLAQIKWEGEPAVDGCGWVLQVEGVRYHPENLESQFKEDELSVSVTFQELGYNGPHCWIGLPAVTILDMEEN